MAEPAVKQLPAVNPYHNSFQRMAQLLLLLAFAFIPRFYGIQWGLPTTSHYFSYHPDEGINAGVVSTLLSGSANPHFFNYPSLLFYLTEGLYKLFGALWASAQGGTIWAQNAAIILCGRTIVTFAGILTIPFVYFLARKHWGEWPGFWAGLALAFAPLHIVQSHYFTVDVLAAFWIVVCLHFASRIWADRPYRIEYIMAGLTAGLAASTKYNAALVFLAVMVAHYFLIKDKEKGKRFFDGRLALALGSFIAAFALTSPYVLLDFGAAWKDISYELRHVATGHGFVFAGLGPGWLAQAQNLWVGLGPAVLVLGLLGLVWALLKKDRGALIIWAFLLPAFLVIAGGKVHFARYALPLAPALVCGLAVPIALSRARSAKALWTLLALASIVFSLGLAWPLVRIMSRSDIRDEAMHTIDHKTPLYAKMGLVEEPWFYSPPIAKYNGGPAYKALFWKNPPNTYELFITGRDAKKLAEVYPDYFITTDFELDDALRAQDPATIAFVAELNKLYEKVATFTRDYGPIERVGRAPHDMRYIAPRIDVWMSYKLSKELEAKEKAEAAQKPKAPVVKAAEPAQHHHDPYAIKRNWFEKLLGLGDPVADEIEAEAAQDNKHEGGAPH